MTDDFVGLNTHMGKFRLQWILASMPVFWGKTPEC